MRAPFQASSKAYQGDVSAADVDGDGNTDLIVLRYPGFDVLRGDGRGGFSPGPSTDFGGYAGDSIMTADFNGDGRPDVAFTDFSVDA